MKIRYKGLIIDRRIDKTVFESKWRENFADAYNLAEDTMQKRKLSPQFYAIVLKEEKYD